MPFQLSEELVDKLLDKLSSDNEFRAAFQKSPRIALAYLGHDAAAYANDSDRGAWACLHCVELASPETIKKSRAALRKQLLTSSAAQSPVTLDMSKKS
ncbi:MAG: NHLP-related RiPP peptide [Arenimonas sp.]